MTSERQVQLYGQSITFLGAPHCSLKEIPEPATAVVVVGIPLDNPYMLGHSRFGPKAIRQGTEPIVFRMQASPGRELVDLSSGRRVRPLARPRLFDPGDLPVVHTDVETNNQIIRDSLRHITET